jgi:outer membrane protein assembly factor BamA
VPTLATVLFSVVPAQAGDATPADDTPKPVTIRPNEVREVKIIGAKNFHPDRIRFILTTRPGMILDPLAMADDVRAIEKMGPFTNARSVVERNPDGSINIVFSMVEQPFVAEVTYPELNYFQRSSLEKFMETKAGGWLKPLILENERRAIETNFQDKGYRFARVTV